MRKLRTGAMPPAGMPRPDEAAYDALASSLERALDAAPSRHAGAPALRRLNRTEYANAVRDLLALEVDAATLLPPDDISGGLRQQRRRTGGLPRAARAVSLGGGKDRRAGGGRRGAPRAERSDLRGARRRIADGARGGAAARHARRRRGAPHVPSGRPVRAQGESAPDEPRRRPRPARAARHRVLDRRSSRVPGDGRWRRGQRPGGRQHRRHHRGARHAADDARDRHGGTARGRGLVPFTHRGAGRLEAAAVPAHDARRRRSLGAASRRQPHHHRPLRRDRHPATRRAGSGFSPVVLVARPTNRAAHGRFSPRWLPADTGARSRAPRWIVCSRSIAPGGSRDPSRPASSSGCGPFWPIPSSCFAPRDADCPPEPSIDDYDLASRLSFFLWSSIPDDELLVLAGKRQLHTGAMLERQVRRMLADPRAGALVSNFAGQWLQLRNLRSSAPDKEEFPDFDDNLRQSFQRETELLRRQHHARGPQRARAADRRLHLRGRAAGQALRHPGRVRQPLPSRCASRCRSAAASWGTAAS